MCMITRSCGLVLGHDFVINNWLVIGQNELRWRIHDEDLIYIMAIRSRRLVKSDVVRFNDCLIGKQNPITVLVVED